MRDGTTAATAPTARPDAPNERRWMSVVLLQGQEADAVLDLIDGYGPEAAMSHLSQWDCGEETRDAALTNGYVYDEIPQTATDRVVRDDTSTYALTYNNRFGYVSLLRRFVPVAEEAPRSITPPEWHSPIRPRATRRTTGHRL